MYFFFFNDTATTEIYTLSLHDALPISPRVGPIEIIEELIEPGHLGGLEGLVGNERPLQDPERRPAKRRRRKRTRSEEHTSELQSRSDLVCRLLLEKTKIYSYLLSHFN